MIPDFDEFMRSYATTLEESRQSDRLKAVRKTDIEKLVGEINILNPENHIKTAKELKQIGLK